MLPTEVGTQRLPTGCFHNEPERSGASGVTHILRPVAAGHIEAGCLGIGKRMTGLRAKQVKCRTV